ncbi:hypothetical protein KL909_005343 [Ogataea angusta]|nr:hypothetical protein KL909_005343 [Ogataea angusta]
MLNDKGEQKLLIGLNRELTSLLLSKSVQMIDLVPDSIGKKHQNNESTSVPVTLDTVNKISCLNPNFKYAAETRAIKKLLQNPANQPRTSTVRASGNVVGPFVAENSCFWDKMPTSELKVSTVTAQ